MRSPTKAIMSAARRAVHRQLHTGRATAERTVAAPPKAALSNAEKIRRTVSDGFRFGVHPGLKQKSAESICVPTQGVPEYDHSTAPVDWPFGGVPGATKAAPDYDHGTAPIEWAEFGKEEGRTSGVPDAQKAEPRGVDWLSHTELGESHTDAANKPLYFKAPSVDGTSYPLHPGMTHVELGEDNGGVLEGRVNVRRSDVTQAVPEYAHIETADGTEYRVHPMLKSMSVDPLSEMFPADNPLVMYANHHGRLPEKDPMTEPPKVVANNYHHGAPPHAHGTPTTKVSSAVFLGYDDYGTVEWEVRL